MTSHIKFILLGLLCVTSVTIGFRGRGSRLIFSENETELFQIKASLPEGAPLNSWMTCFWLKVNLQKIPEFAEPDDEFSLLSYSEFNLEVFRLSLKLKTSRLQFFTKDSLVTDIKIDRLTDGSDHYVCYAWRSAKDLWKVLVDGKEYKSGSLEQFESITKNLVTKTTTGVIKIGDVNSAEEQERTDIKYQLEISNVLVYHIEATKEILLLGQPEILISKKKDVKYFRVVLVNILDENSSEEKSSSSEKAMSSSSVSDEKQDDKQSSSELSAEEADMVEIRNLLKRKLPNKDVQIKLFATHESKTDSDSTEKACLKVKRETRSEKSDLKAPVKDDVMLSDQPRKEVVEETVNKKKASKDEFALSDILNDGNLNKIKDFGSKFDPSFNTKLDSIFNRNGGSSPATGNSGSMGGLGGFGGLGNIGGFGGGGSGGGMPNFGSLASALGGGGGTGGFNVNQFLGSNGLSNFFKKGGDKTPSNPSYPSNPTNPYPSNPNYPTNPSNPPAYNPNYPPPNSNTGNLYPTLPKDAPPAIPLSNNNNNKNRGSVGLSDILGGLGGLGTRGTDVAKPNNGPGYDISFGEIFGFGSSKKKDQNPNYPENNHQLSSGGVSLKDILGFGSKKDESKNSYVPNYGTIGGGIETTKTRPKSNFDEISEGLGLNVDPDPIVRNNNPIVVLNQPNQSSKSSLSESAYKPKGASSLSSQRTSSNSYSSRRPISESSALDAQRAVEEQIIQSTKVKRTRRELSPEEIKYQQKDNLQNIKEIAV